MDQSTLSLCSSSEDELDVLLNGTPDQKKKLIREYLTGESESSSGDEFEKEMEAELSSTIRDMEGTWAPSAAGNDEASSGETGTQYGGAPDTLCLFSSRHRRWRRRPWTSGHQDVR